MHTCARITLVATNGMADRGYNTNLDYKKFHPTLKMTQRKAMKPYIDIVDSIKASSMTKFDGLL